MRIGVFLHQLLKLGVQFCLGLLPVDARLKTSKRIHPGVVSNFEAATARDKLAVHHEGYPDVAAKSGITALKFARRDADNGEGMLVEGNSLAEDRVFALVTALPEGVANDGNRSTACRTAFYFRESSAYGWPDFQNFEVIGVLAFNGASYTLAPATQGQMELFRQVIDVCAA